MNSNRVAANITEISSLASRSRPPVKLNLLDRVMIQHSHPTKLILDSIAYIWGLYFFSRHELALGLIALFGVGGLGTLLTIRENRAELARTVLGRFFYVTANPLNLSLQVIGYVVVSFGSWNHSTPMILSGVTAILLGHLFGWERFRRI